jgi:hypothetical protein
LGFTSIDDSSGKGLTDVIPKFLEKNKIEWNTIEDKGMTVQSTWSTKIVLYKRKF